MYGTRLCQDVSGGVQACPGVVPCPGCVRRQGRCITCTVLQPRCLLHLQAQLADDSAAAAEQQQQDGARPGPPPPEDAPCSLLQLLQRAALEGAALRVMSAAEGRQAGADAAAGAAADAATVADSGSSGSSSSTWDEDDLAAELALSAKWEVGPAARMLTCRWHACICPLQHACPSGTLHAHMAHWPTWPTWPCSRHVPPGRVESAASAAAAVAVHMPELAHPICLHTVCAAQEPPVPTPASG